MAAYLNIAGRILLCIGSIITIGRDLSLTVKEGRSAECGTKGTITD